MDQFAALNPPQDRNKPKRRPKSIFDDDALLIEKGHAYLQIYQELQNRIMAGSNEPLLFASQIAKLLNISEQDAQQLPEFALMHLGEFEANIIRSQYHLSLDLDGNELARPFDPFGLEDI